jgi:glycosyltransferase involved in cell wall biosynthesis
MKVAISAVSAKLGGAANYVRNLANELAALNLADEFIFFVPEEHAGAIRGLAPNISASGSGAGHASYPERLWFDHVTLRRVIKDEGVDVLYSTANMAMFACPCPQVLLVRNSLHFSDYYLTRILPFKGWRTRLDDALRRRMICQSVGWADVVMTPSQSMLDDLRRYKKIPAAKAEVNPYGTVLERFQQKAGAPIYGNGGHRPRGFKLLHVSHYADHKNVGILFKALDVLHGIGVDDVTLSTTADVEDSRYPVSYYRVTDRALLSRPAIGERVRKLGDVPHHQLPSVYRAHDLFVFPSLTESYGHPLVEAMASGLPVVAADTPASRELCGDAAVYFDPFSADDLASKIRQLMADEALKQDLRRRGLSRAKSATWSAHVARLLDIFRRLARSGKKEKQ